MRTLALAVLLAGAASAATYSYSIYNVNGNGFVSTDLNAWTKNGTILCSYNGGGPCPVNSTTATGGSMIWTTGVPSEYEISVALSSALGTGGAVIYVHASSNALSTPGGSADTGTFDAVQIYDPVCASDGKCTASFAVYERTSSTGFHLLGMSSMNYWPGIGIRVVAYGNVMSMLADGQIYTFSVGLQDGYPGIGAFNNTGGAIVSAQIGPRCMTTPNPVLTSDVTISAYPTNVSLNWFGAAQPGQPTQPPQPADVMAVGIYEWYTVRNGAFYGETFDAAAWSDPNVTPSSTYTYQIAPRSLSTAWRLRIRRR